MPTRKIVNPVEAAGQLKQLKTLQQQNKSLQQELGKAREEAKALEAAVAVSAETSKQIEAERKRLEPRHALLREASPDARDLWQGLKTAVAELVQKDQTISELRESRKAGSAELQEIRTELEETRRVLQVKKDEGDRLRAELLEKFEREQKASAAELEKAHKELERVNKREQVAQLKALAERTELEGRVEKALRELEALRRQFREKETLWGREQEKLDKAVATLKEEKAALAAQRQADLRIQQKFAAALEALGQSIPALAGKTVESKDFGRILKEYFEAGKRRQERIAELEAILDDYRKKLAEAENLDDRIGGLIALNRALQEELEGTLADHQLLEGRIEELQAETAANAQKELQVACEELERLKTRIETLSRENASFMAQLQQEGKIAVLSPERVSMMLNDFQASLQAGMKGVEISEGEVKLKVGIGAVDENSPGFIVPTATNISELSEGLSEISFRFGKLPTASE